MKGKKEKVIDDDICPICKTSESAHGCESCGRYVCQDCYDFDQNVCVEHQELEEDEEN